MQLTLVCLLCLLMTVAAERSQAVVRLQVGMGVSLPGDGAAIDVGIQSGGFPTVATVNEIQYPRNVTVDPGTCRLRAGLAKTLIATADPTARTLRVAVAADDNLAVIADGPLYRCDFVVAAGTQPGKLKLRNQSAEAFGPNGEHLRSPQVVAGQGELQVTLVLPQSDCDGDCDGDGTVRIADLIAGVRVLLGESTIDGCGAADADGDGRVSVADLVRGVRSALDGCSSGPQPVLSIVSLDDDSIDQPDSVRSGSANVDVCQSICNFTGDLVNIEFETFTQTRANVVLKYSGATPLTLDTYTVSVLDSGVPPQSQRISQSFPASRCALTARACAVDSDCSPGEICEPSLPKIVAILLYDFVTKELLRGGMHCPSINFKTGVIDPGNVIPQSYETEIVFSGTNGVGERISGAGSIRGEFFDANNCGD